MNKIRTAANEPLACPNPTAGNSGESDKYGEGRIAAAIRFWNLAWVVLPLVGLVVGIVLLWGRGFDWLLLTARGFSRAAPSYPLESF